jgi:sugar phosphate isomerase/epimerase
MLLLWTESLKGYGLDRIFELTKKAEYSGVDLAVNFDQFDTYNPEYLNSIKEKHNLSIHSISAPDQLSSSKINELINLAKKVGAKILIIQPPKFHERKLANWIKKEIPKIREKEEISIALENSSPGTIFGFIPERTLTNAQDMKKFKHISLDTARVAEKKQDLMRIYHDFKKFLVHIHLSNFDLSKKYMPLKEGILPLESFLAKLKQDKYPGAISIKILPKYLHAGVDEDVIKELKEIKEFYHKYYADIEITNDQEDIDEAPDAENNLA